MSKYDRFDLSLRDHAGGVDDIDSGQNLKGDAAKAERKRRAEMLRNVFEDQQQRDHDMKVARQLALGRLGETGPRRNPSPQSSDAQADAKHVRDYQQYLRQLNIEDGS